MGNGSKLGSISSDELAIILSGLVFVHPVMTIVSIMWGIDIMDITPIWPVFSVCFVTLWVIFTVLAKTTETYILAKTS